MRTSEPLPIRIQAQPHPLRPHDNYLAEVPAGLSLTEIVGPHAAGTVHIFMHGEEIPRHWWPHIRPKPGQELNVRVYPHGSDVLRTVLSIAVIVAAIYVGQPEAAGGLGWGAFGSAAVEIGGMALVNALVPVHQPLPPPLSNSYNRENALTGTQNQTNRWGPPPCVLGTMRYFPPLASLPYTEVSGDDQYIRLLLNLGYGNLSIDPINIEIGGTPIDTYGEVEYQIGAPGAISLFSQDITETQPGADLNDWPGGASYATHTTDVATDEIGVDLTFPGGLYGLDATGNYVQVTVGFTIEYAPTGTGAWVDATATPSTTKLTISNGACVANYSVSIGGLHTFEVTGKTNAPLRIGIRWKVAQDQYDVQISRVSGPPYSYTGAVNHVSDCQWSAFRSIHHQLPYTIANTTLLAIRAKSSDRLNGSLQQVSVLASQQIPDSYVGGVWGADAVTDNPGWQYIWLLKGAGGANKKAQTDAKLDLTELTDWAANCTSAGHQYNAVIDAQTTVDQALRDIAAAGFASFARSNGLYSVTQDIDQATPVQVFTPRNSSAFSMTRTFLAPPHALRVQFVNPNANWVTDEFVVYWDGYNADGSGGLIAASIFETFEARGCTDPNEAWRIGRHQLATRWLRPNTYTLTSDIENLRCVRGNLARFAHDVIDKGLSFGRIKTVTTAGSPALAVSITIDEPVDFDGVSSYSVNIRKNDGSSVISVVTVTGGGAQPGVTELQLSTGLAGIKAGDLFIFGISGSESVDLRILRIIYATDLGAQLILVDRAASIYTAGSGTPPTFVSSVTGVPWCEKPPPPDIGIMLSGSLVAHAVSGGGGSDYQVPIVQPDHGGITRPIIIVGARTKTP